MVYDARDAFVGAEDLQDAQRLRGERLDRAEQRDLGVERLAGPGHERRRNAEGDVVVAPHQEGRAGGVPGGVAAGLEGRAEPARREARSVRLALDQLGAGEVEDHPAAAVRARRASRASRRSGRSAAGTSGCSALAPFSIAQSFIDAATTSATAGSSGSPWSMVRRRLRYTSLGSRCRITLREKTSLPKIESTRSAGGKVVTCACASLGRVDSEAGKLITVLPGHRLRRLPPFATVVAVAELGERLEIAAVGLDGVRGLVALLGEVREELSDLLALAGHGAVLYHEGTKDTKNCSG